MKRQATIVGSILGGIAVILGALGAHALEDLISASQLNSFNTGVRYQIYHAILLIVLGVSNIAETKSLKTILNLFTIGTCVFSFSIYLLSTKDLTGLSLGFILGPITPIGGLLLITAWGLLARFFVVTKLATR